MLKTCSDMHLEHWFLAPWVRHRILIYEVWVSTAPVCATMIMTLWSFRLQVRDVNHLSLESPRHVNCSPYATIIMILWGSAFPDRSIDSYATLTIWVSGLPDRSIGRCAATLWVLGLPPPQQKYKHDKHWLNWSWSWSDDVLQFWHREWEDGNSLTKILP